MKITSDGIELKILVPHEQLQRAAPPEYYSQRNCDQLGVGHRTFLELLRRPGAPPVLKIGKLRCVKRDLMLAFLERIREQAEREEKIAESELDEADRVLLETGCAPKRRKAG